MLPTLLLFLCEFAAYDGLQFGEVPSLGVFGPVGVALVCLRTDLVEELPQDLFVLLVEEGRLGGILPIVIPCATRARKASNQTGSIYHKPLKPIDTYPSFPVWSSFVAPLRKTQGGGQA
jgi:hypothetical protein